MTATFSLFALMHGIVAPRTIEIYNPTIDLTVNSETGDYEDVPQTDDSETRFSVKNVLTRLEQEHYLRRFSLIDARARITDVSHNAVWNIPNLTLTYSRRRGKHKLHGAFRRNRKKTAVGFPVRHVEKQSQRRDFDVIGAKRGYNGVARRPQI